jgi:Protein of unknown function (DUF4238)
MVNLVHRQHVVSNFYLRGFADDRKQVRRVELPGDKRYNVATNNASVVKDFYTITLPDGTRSDAFERMFSGIEDVASSALRAVVAEGVWPLVGERREALAAWAALQHLRSEGVRNSQVQMQAQMIRLVVGVSGKEALRELISRAEGRDVDDVELDAEWADLTKPSGPDLIPDPAQHLKRFARSGDMVVVHHRDRPQWRRNEKGRWWVWRIRWMPRSAAAMTSSRVSPARLASSTPLRLDHSGSTGLSSGA